MAHTVFVRTNRGITLLEVLISIGILAIGLMGTLALVPAGGSLLRKAQKESRAAALIPNAFDVMKTSNLFSENALLWLVDGPSTHNESEDSLNGYRSNYKDADYQPPKTASMNLIEQEPDDQPDGDWYDRDDPPVVTGQVELPDDDDEEIEDVSLNLKGPAPSNVQHQDSISTINEDTGNWSTEVAPQNFVVPGSDTKMTFFETGDNPGEIDSYFDEWDFEVDRGTIDLYLQGLGSRNESGANGTTSGTEVSGYRHYKTRRKKDTLRGDAHLDFSFSLYGYDENTNATNDDVDSAEIERVPTGYDKVIRRFKGSLWRYEFGRILGSYKRARFFENEISNGPSQPIEELKDPIPMYGADWVDSNWQPKEDPHPNDPTGRTFSDEFDKNDGYKGNTIDWYEIRTDKDEYPIYQGQQFEVDCTETTESIREKGLSDQYRADPDDREDPDSFFVGLNGVRVPDANRESRSPNQTKYLYTAPGDGFLNIKTELRNVLEEDEDGNDLSLTAEPNNWRLNHLNGNELPYDFEVTIFGPHRVALVDPLMCSQIEYIAAEWARVNGQPITAHPLYERDKEGCRV